MKMISALIMSVVVLAIAGNAFAWTNYDKIVARKERLYEVTRSNGKIDTFVYIFEAHLVAHMRQTGRASKPFHPVDTRQCAYSVKSYIARTGYWVNGAGERFVYAKLTKQYGAKDFAVHTNTPLEQITGRHSPCGDYVGHYSAMQADIKNKLLKHFEMILIQKLVPISEAEAFQVIKPVSFNFVR